MTWNNECRAALAKLFDAGLANPKHQQSHEIDPYFELDPAFAKYAGRVELFRKNFRTFANAYMRGKSLLGQRRGECPL